MRFLFREVTPRKGNRRTEAQVNDPQVRPRPVDRRLVHQDCFLSVELTLIKDAVKRITLHRVTLSFYTLDGFDTSKVAVLICTSGRPKSTNAVFWRGLSAPAPAAGPRFRQGSRQNGPLVVAYLVLARRSRLRSFSLLRFVGSPGKLPRITGLCGSISRWQFRRKAPGAAFSGLSL